MTRSLCSAGYRGAGARMALGLLVVVALVAAPGTAQGRARGAWLGIAARPSSGGVQVTRLLYRGAAVRAGVRVGDLVTAIDGKPVRTLADARAVVAGRSVHTPVRLTLRRGSRQRSLVVRTTRAPKAPGYLRLFLVHAPMPDFTLPTVVPAGRVTLSALRGRVVLVLFWASWCDVCKSALPRLERLQRIVGRRKLAVVAISRDRELAPLEAVVRRLGLTVIVAHDASNAVGKANRVAVVPSLLFLGRFGVVRGYVQGAAYTTAQLRRTVRRLLAQRRKRPSRARIPGERWL